MRVTVFPSRDLQRVEPIVRRALANRPGADELSLIITRVSYPGGWYVEAKGLGDRLLEHGLSETVADALKRAGI